MKTSSELLNLPLIGLKEGKELGIVQEILINGKKGIVEALVIKDDTWYFGAKVLPFKKISGAGIHAVTTETADNLLRISDAHEYQTLLQENIKVIGTQIISCDGNFLGQVTEIKLDTTGKIVECNTNSPDASWHTIMASQIVTFDSSMLILREDSKASENILPASIQSTSVPKPTIAPLQQSEAALPETPTNAETKMGKEIADTPTQKFEEKHRKFLLGKHAAKHIETENGFLIVAEGGEITEEVLQKAKLAGKFVELSMNVKA